MMMRNGDAAHVAIARDMHIILCCVLAVQILKYIIDTDLIRVCYVVAQLNMYIQFGEWCTPTTTMARGMVCE